jgi:small subunit ribosomal protein S13
VIRSHDPIEGSQGRITPDTSADGLCGLPFTGIRRKTVDQTKGSTHLMARLIGVDLPRDKRLEVALTYIYGIGKTRALQTLEATQISGDLRVNQLSDEHLVALRDWIEANYQIEGDLRREVASDIRRKVEIGSYQGRRHRSGLPVRGQRTRTNARSRKGARKPVAGKKKAK